MMKNLNFIGLTFLITVSASLGFAEKMDTDTHTFVINKFEASLKNNSNIADQVGLRIRLGDLYSERARLQALNEIEKNCDNCFKSKQDRIAAINHYSSIENKAQGTQRTRVLFQKAHLLQLNDQQKAAQGLYQKILAEGAQRHEQDDLGIAHTELGHIYFKQTNFKQAKAHYLAALDNAKTPKKGFVWYKLGWANLNLGLTSQAIVALENILTQNKLIEEISSDSDSFHLDVTKDLASFYAKGNLQQAQIRRILELAPINQREAVLAHIAQESNRVGKKYISLVAWDMYVQSEDNTAKLSDAHLNRAQLQVDINQKEKAIETLKLVNKLLASPCRDEFICPTIQPRYQSLIHHWSRLEKRKPTQQLVLAHMLFIDAYPADAGMHFKTAKLAQSLKMHQQAFELFEKSSKLAHADLKKQASKDNQILLDASVLGCIDSAESSKNVQYRMRAYDLYLNLNPQGNKFAEVRYQRAHLIYQNKKYDDAASEFRVIALDAKTGTPLMRKQSADLALDSLVILKKDTEIETWAQDFAKALPKHADQYLKIARKAGLNQVVLSLNNSKSSNTQLREALGKLDNVSLRGASYEEHLSVYENKILLAKKLEKIDTVIISATQILALKGLKDQDQQKAQETLLWAYELNLDFAKAYLLAKKMQFKNLSPADRELRLGALAELAGMSAKSHYESYVKLEKKADLANVIRARLVRMDRNSWTSLQKHKSELLKTPKIYAELGLEIFAKTRSPFQGKQLLATRQLKNLPEVVVLNRYFATQNYKSLANQLRVHKIVTRNDQLLAKSLAQRTQFLNQVKQFTVNATQQRDWTLQALGLSLMSNEYKRLHQEVLNLPTPKHLRGPQKEQYEKAVAMQAQPILAEHHKAAKELDKIWDNKPAIEAVLRDHEMAKYPIKALFDEELRNLIAIAPIFTANRFSRALSTKDSNPTTKEIQAATRRLRQDPFDRSKSENLKDLARKTGSQVLLTFLDTREQKMAGGRL